MHEEPARPIGSNPTHPAARAAKSASAGVPAGAALPAVKQAVGELARFGGAPVFARGLSTSNLVAPSFDTFLAYSRTFFDQRRYTNDGPLVRQLEQRLAGFHQTKHCIAFCSGFWALAMSMKCVALEGRTEIVMPSLSYRRMADIASWAGLTPHFCEVDPATLAVRPEDVEPCLNANTALILGVHPFVNCCDADGLAHLGQRVNLPVLFDSVESMYETVGGRKVGSFGAAETFSMHASKLINGFEGGYVTTDDDRLAARLARMRAFGFYGQDNIEELGMNAKLNEVHAAMALAGLDDLESQVVRNRHRYEQYRSLLQGVPGLRLMEFDESQRCSFKNILVELRDDWPLSRADTLAILNAEGMLARAYYDPPLHRQKVSYPAISGDLPVTDRLAMRYMLLPCGHFVHDADTVQIVATLRYLFDHADEIDGRLRGSDEACGNPS